MKKAVIVGIIDPKEDKLLVLHRAEQSQMQGWCLPGGVVEAGEYLLDTAVREVKEETGIIINPLQLRFAGFTDGSRDELICLYWIEKPEQEVTLSPEHQDSAWITVDEPLEWAGLTHTIVRIILEDRKISQSRKGLLR